MKIFDTVKSFILFPFLLKNCLCTLHSAHCVYSKHMKAMVVCVLVCVGTCVSVWEPACVCVRRTQGWFLQGALRANHHHDYPDWVGAGQGGG